MTVVVLDTPTDSSSAEFRSFLLSMRIDDSESTTNSLFSGFIEDGAGRRETSEGEKNVALCSSLSLRTLLANSHASQRAHRSCLNVSS